MPREVDAAARDLHLSTPTMGRITDTVAGLDLVEAEFR
jgi:hypothetical protein